MMQAVDRQIQGAVEQGLNRTPSIADGGNIRRIAQKNGEEELRKVAQDFESIFLSMMMKSMRQTIKKSGFISGGRGEEVFEGLLDMNIASEASRSGSGFGIAKMLLKNFSGYVKTTGETGMEGAVMMPASHQSFGSSGGSSLSRGYPLTAVRGEQEWIG